MRTRAPAARTTSVHVLMLVTVAPLSAQDAPAALPSLAEPGISPDATEIAFVSGGDIWTVPVAGGAARLLVAHSADESRPLYSPDGRRLAFNSNREGSLDVFVMDLETGEIRRLTHSSGNEQLDGWSESGEWIYFSSNEDDISGMQDVFRVRVTGGTPMAVAGDEYETEFFAAPGPAGVLAVATRGRMAHAQWWRNGHAHIDESEIWLVHEGDPPRYERVVEGGKNLWPMWAPSGDHLYFMSDRSGAENLWAAPARPGAAAEPVTEFADGRVLWPSIAVERPVIVFERDFGIWTHDVETGRTRQVDVRLLGSVEGPTPKLERVEEDFDALAVSPDGKKIALVVRGEIFAAPAEGGAPAVRVTDTPAAEVEPTWSPDSERLAYTSWRTGTPQIFLHDFRTDEERRLTSADARDSGPAFSPDGAWLAYNRDGRELHVIELENGRDRLLASGTSGASSFVWSPDSRWIAYGGRTDEFTNVMVVAVGGGKPRQVSFLANSFFGSLGWSRDGAYLVFRTSQRTEPGRLARVDLVPLTPTFHEDSFWDLFNRDQTEERPEREPDPASASDALSDIAAVPSEVAIDFEGIRRRGYFADVDFGVGSVLLSPDAEHAAVTGEGGLYWVSLDEDVEPRRLGPGGEMVAFSADGGRLWMLRGGRIQVVSVPTGEARTIETSAELTIDFDREKIAVFEQGWAELRDGFYDDAFHGTDWDAVRRRFAPRMAGARTRAEQSRLMNLMVGELDASHLGHGYDAGHDPIGTGRLGVRFDRATYEDRGAFRVSDVVALSPADVSDRIDAGDYLLAVDGASLDGSSDLDEMLAGRAGDRVTLTVADDASGAGIREVELQPIELGAERELVYRAWVEGRRAYVDEVSGGRLGYVHLASMSEGALEQLVFDLDQINHGREGVVVDVRNNNGGFVNVYAIDILARRNYFTMENRGGIVAPSRVQLGQRALLAPTVLVTNQHTLSDGEDFTEGYRTLGLGSVVGERTAGWIIYTGSTRLVDGSTLRMPRTRIRDTRGQVMERNPRPVDVEVIRPAGESYLGRDSQLERAVEVLLQQLDQRATTSGSR